MDAPVPAPVSAASLHADILSVVLSFLTAAEALAASGVCRAWCEVAMDEVAALTQLSRRLAAVYAAPPPRRALSRDAILG
jgi:hypothetical protein